MNYSSAETLNEKLDPSKAISLPYDLDQLKTVKTSDLQELKSKLENRTKKLSEDIYPKNFHPDKGQKEELTSIDNALEAGDTTKLSEHARMEHASLLDEFKDEVRELYESAKDTLKTAVDNLIIKPAQFTWETMKNHPILSIAAVLAIAATWYFSPEIAYGTSVAMEKASEVLGGVLVGTLGPKGSATVTKQAMQIAQEFISSESLNLNPSL